MSEIIVGIDLGTTNSLVAICDERGGRVLAPPGQSPLVPSAVRYEETEGALTAGPVSGTLSPVVGADARERAVEFPQATITSVKRLMGRALADAAADLPYLPYQVVEGPRQTMRVLIPRAGAEPVALSPEQVSADILRALKQRAEDVLGRPISKAVVTVPAYFDDAQRHATRDAGRLAGLEVVRIVNEPTAAALAYGLGLDRASARNRGISTVAVYDLGGGTFDVSILRLTPGAEGETSFYQTLSTAGDTHLGGDDVDHMLVALFVREIREVLGEEVRAPGEASALTAEPVSGTEVDLSRFPPATRRALKGFAQAVKERLSEEERAQVRIDLGEGRIYDRTVTRDELEAMMAPWVERTSRACERALRDARRELTPHGVGGYPGVDAVLMVGGSTRIPLVRQKAAEIFGVEPYTALDPDQVVALGAATQAAILSGALKGSLLLDVIPLSLGVETAGGAVAKIIMRNSAVPARATEMFSTSVDGQVSIKLNIVQGEREMAADCRSLGEFHLRGLPPMPAGVPQLEVAFAVDANGVLDVTAHERRSGKRASLQVIPNHGLTSEEVDRMEAEGIEHAREDMLRHRVVDLITNSRLDLKWIGERLERYGAKLEAEQRSTLEAKISSLRQMIEQAETDWQSVDADEFARAKQALDEASVRLQEIGIAESLKAEPMRRPDSRVS
ncbi:MAG: Hsp70 family protein [Phycisphaerales bacterium JB039]